MDMVLIKKKYSNKINSIRGIKNFIKKNNKL